MRRAGRLQSWNAPRVHDCTWYMTDIPEQSKGSNSHLLAGWRTHLQYVAVNVSSYRDARHFARVRRRVSRLRRDLAYGSGRYDAPVCQGEILKALQHCNSDASHYRDSRRQSRAVNRSSSLGANAGGQTKSHEPHRRHLHLQNRRINDRDIRRIHGERTMEAQSFMGRD